jgi:hypothetical protein
MSKLQIKELPIEVASAVKDIELHGTRVKLFDNDKVVAEIIPGSAALSQISHDPHGSDALLLKSSSEYKTMGESLLKR